MAAYQKIFFFLGGGVWGGVLEGPSFHFPNPPPWRQAAVGKANQDLTVARGQGRSTLLRLAAAPGTPRRRDATCREPQKDAGTHL